jgi:hypothetical protein
LNVRRAGQTQTVELLRLVGVGFGSFAEVGIHIGDVQSATVNGHGRMSREGPKGARRRHWLNYSITSSASASKVWGAEMPIRYRGLEINREYKLLAYSIGRSPWLRGSRSIAAQSGLDKQRGDFGDALNQAGNVRDKLHNSVPKCRKDSFIPFTHGLFHKALPRQSRLLIS